MTNVARDPELGFYRLDPVPDPDELADFYQSGYYDLLRRDGGRAPDLARLAAEDSEADTELQWLRATVFSDFIDLAEEHAAGRRVLEIGCGRGDLLTQFQDAGWEAIGLEPAADVAAACRDRGLDVRTATLADLAATEPRFRPDAVVMRFVLEHVPDPLALLREVAETLEPGGVLVVEVPNDFNDLQEAAVRKLDSRRWWIANPDHVNYFDFDTLTRTLGAVGFDVAHRSTTFPMELFLLMGHNYIDGPEVGATCHRWRRELELSLDASTRRRLYGALAAAGLGRSCLVAAIRR